MEATADQAIAKLKELFVKAVSTVAAAKDRIKGKDNEKISEAAWWFPMFASSTCTSLASCLGLSDDNLKVLTDTAGRYCYPYYETSYAIYKKRRARNFNMLF